MKGRWLFGLGAAAGAAMGGAAVLKARNAAELAERVRRLQAVPAAQGRNIVILGAGFGGINTAMALLRQLPPASGWTVTLIDRHNYFLFTPLLYHAATGLVDPTALLFPVRSLSRADNFVFREATVLDVDFKRRLVHLDDGVLPYDYLVLGLGSATNFFGRERELRSALTLKLASDSIAIRNRIIDAFERADVAIDPEERRRCLTIAVVGGGATGVELIGSIRGLIAGTLAHQYPRIRPEDVRLLLFEASPGLLPGLPRELADYALRRLREVGVDIRLECPVRHVDEDGLVMENGEFVPSRTVVWTAGVRPQPIVERIDAPKVRDGRIDVDPCLEVPGFPGVYALGDIAAFRHTEDGKPLPPSAAVAVQQGKALARILLARLENRQPEPFQYEYRGELVSLGRHEAVADIKGVQLTGFPAWLVWRAFYLSQLMGFKNQLTVALDWSFAYFYQRDTVRLDVPCGPCETELLVAEEPEREPALTGR